MTTIELEMAKAGIDVSELPDKLRSTYMKAILEKLGGDPDSLPDGLVTTHLGAILEHCGGSSGGGIANGTMYFGSEQGISTNSDIKLVHNLGYVPQNVLWFIVDSTSTSNGYLVGARKCAFEYISSTRCISFDCSSSSATATTNMGCYIKDMTAYAEEDRLLTHLQPNETDCLIFVKHSARASATIPAGSTIMWMVW